MGTRSAIAAIFRASIDSSIGCFALLLFAASPAALHAQFTDPTPEEIQMTSEPKAPGAPAIYLYREQTIDDHDHFIGYYERIKVLTEKGKEFATVRIPYTRGVDKVTEIHARTIHADGSVIPLTTKPDDLVDFKTKGLQVDTIVFTMPSAEVGCILEYRLKIRVPETRASEPTWNVQEPYFIRKAHYSFRVHTGTGIVDSSGRRLTRIMYELRLDPDVKMVHDEKKDIFSLDLTNIPPIPAEDWMPPLNTVKWHVRFYFTNATSESSFWDDARADWARYVEYFIAPTNELKQGAAGIVSASDSEEQKFNKIYAGVMKLDNTDFSREKSAKERKKEKLKDIHTAGDVWKQQSGNASEIALLYVALARAAGLKAYPVQVVDRDRALFDSSLLSIAQLNDYLAVIELGGKDLYIDPGQKMCPFGRLHWRHTYAGGFRLTDKGAVNVNTPGGNYKTAAVNRVADLQIDPQGNLNGIVRFVMIGPEALYWRQLSLENDPEEVKKQFDNSLKGSLPEGVQASFDHFLGLEDYSANLMGFVNVTGSLGAATGKRFFLPGLFFESRSAHPFVAQEKRTTPVDVHYPRSIEDEVTFHLPPGYSVESAPQSTRQNWPDHAVLAIDAANLGDSVLIKRILVYNFVLLGSKDYPLLHEFFQKVATADQQQLVLTRVAAAKGN